MTDDEKGSSLGCGVTVVLLLYFALPENKQDTVINVIFIVFLLFIIIGVIIMKIRGDWWFVKMIKYSLITY